jgi:methionyl-tRNA synthetase
MLSGPAAETKHWYLPLNEYRALAAPGLVEDHKQDWKANVYDES